jgi:uncharacterized DUF497 family protein
MHFVFDIHKDQTNLVKHGLALSLAVSMNWDTTLIWQDQRKNYAEVRNCALLTFDQRVYFVAFVDRGSERRIISLRKANLREAKHYVSQTSTHFP